MRYQYFIASRWRNKTSALELTNKIRQRGKTVYCYIEGDGTDYALKKAGEDQTPNDFMKQFETIPNWQSDPKVKEIFDVDMQALKQSESLILLLPAGKSSHIEAGIAYGMRKKCIIIGQQEKTESLYLIFDYFYNSIDEFISSL